MRTSSLYLLISGLLLLFCHPANGQQQMLKQSIYFETAQSNLTVESKATLDALLDSLKNFQNYRLFISGNTDNVGDSAYNVNLSKLRVNATKDYFILHGVFPKIITTLAFGEEKPIADNQTENGKQRNRRVGISISYTPKEAVDSSSHLESISELYKLTARMPQEFCIDPTRDTVLNCEQGAVLYVKANSFRVLRSCDSKCVSIKVKEAYLKSDMILDALSTTSNGLPIESQGMIYTEARDCKGNKLSLLKGKDLLIFVPTDTIVPETKIFTGNRTPHDSILNWTASNNSVLANFSLAELNDCNGIADLVIDGNSDSCERCRFFFCRIMRVDNYISGARNEEIRVENKLLRRCQREYMYKRFFERHRKRVEKRTERRIERLKKRGKYIRPKKPRKRKDVLTSDDNRNYPCSKLNDLYKSYGVTNMDDLVNALNKPLLDSFGVNTIAELQDTMRKLNMQNIELSYMNKAISYKDYNYYVYNISQLGWSNVDVFAKLPKESLVNLKVNLKVQENTDCKLVFKDRRMIIPATKTDKKYEFGNMPKGESAWIVALKYEDGQPFLSLEEITIDSETYKVNFKALTLDELKEELKKLDR